ncbi:MAG TPA: efflux RND transporter periplasmic adaptor subunit [Bacillota bacterium]|nr:efflux RND transporter periplasmic adaptor subunit [Bacillota bacterium]
MAEAVINELGTSIRNKRKKKIILLSLVGLILCGAGVYVYPKLIAKQATAPSLQWATVQRGDVTETVAASGTVQASKQASLTFSGSSNKLTSVNVKVGDHVKAGQVLATVDVSTAQIDVNNALASLASAQANLAQAKEGSTEEEIAIQQANVNKAKITWDAAKNAYETQKQLFAAGAGTKSDLDAAKNNLDQAEVSYQSAVAQLNQVKAPPKSTTILSAEAALKQAQAGLEQKQIALDQLTLTAPMDGVIVQVNGNVGELPKNDSTSSSSTGFIVMDNSDSGSIEVLAQISQTDIGKMKEGMKATFTSSAFSDKKFAGKVSVIYPEATTDSGVTTYKVLLTVDNQEGLMKPGMTVNVTVEVGTHNNVLYIPASAMKDQNGKDVVYLKGAESSGGAPTSNGGQQGVLPYHSVPITIGYYSSDMVEVISGLNEGDQVALTSSANSTSSTSNKKNSNGFGGMPGIGGPDGPPGGMGGGR